MDELRNDIRSFLGLASLDSAITLRVHDESRLDGFSRKAVSFPSDGERVEAFLFEPENKRSLAVVALHQHNSQWHFGKSEIAGLVGDPLQAFGPELARAGVSVLAPDAVGFESRRTRVDEGELTRALAPEPDPSRGGTRSDWLQYYNHAMHRLAQGELLMRKLLTDVANAVSVLGTVSGTPNVGVMGHSHGGNVALFAGALDTRVAFTVSSGALASYRQKFSHGTGLDMALVIPGFAARFDLDDLVSCIAPRSLFVVSADADPFSADAEVIVERARPTYGRLDAADRLHHLRTKGPHALDEHRFRSIVDWVARQPDQR